MDMGLTANERAQPTVYSMRRLNFFKVILATWCRGEVTEEFYHYNLVTEPFSTSIIWSLWSLQMAGTSRSDQMAVTEPPRLLLNPSGPN